MNSIRNLLYLLQLEEYDLMRFKSWLNNNPGKIVLEKKKHIDWTAKAKLIFVLANILKIFVNDRSALEISVKILSPIDKILKKILVFLSSQKINWMPNLTVIGITGSYGKTTIKNILAHILTHKYKTLKTEGNYNTLLGTAKTILQNLRNNHDIFACEMAAYQLGDIKAISKLAKPKIGIITAIGPMHLERFGLEENILKTKLELIESLPPKGIGFLPEQIKSHLTKDSHYSNYGSQCKIEFFSSQEELFIKIGEIFNINKEEVLGRLKTAPQTPHRQEIIKTSSDITIIDDTYNSNPAGFISALETLKNIPAERRILVTPGMIELGSRQFELNKEAALRAAKIADYIIIVGETNKFALEEGAREELGPDFENKVFWVKDLDMAKSRFSELAIPNSAILLENDLPDHYF